MLGVMSCHFVAFKLDSLRKLPTIAKFENMGVAKLVLLLLVQL